MTPAEQIALYDRIITLCVIIVVISLINVACGIAYFILTRRKRK